MNTNEGRPEAALRRGGGHPPKGERSTELRNCRCDLCIRVHSCSFVVSYCMDTAKLPNALMLDWVLMLDDAVENHPVPGRISKPFQP